LFSGKPPCGGPGLLLAPQRRHALGRGRWRGRRFTAGLGTRAVMR
jgi:hypothetical protein